MCINENSNGVLFLALVDKGFSKPTAFSCLDRIKGEFDGLFTDDQIKNAKLYGLNNDFKGAMEKAYVSLTLDFESISNKVFFKQQIEVFIDFLERFR